ncbi:MAG: non-heme iron oxygenase ferredoxin subunit [Calditrichota bacterium]
MPWVKTISVDELDENKLTRTILDNGHAIVMIRLPDGIYALDDTCTHAEASLSEGEVIGDHVRCPLHGAEFEISTGQVKSFPAVVGVNAYQTKVEGNMILVKYEE